MKFYSLNVCDTRELMAASVEAMKALSFAYNDEVSGCPLNVELRALLAEGKSEDDIYTAISAHHNEGPYDLFWSAAVFSPVTRLSNEAHQAAVVTQMIAQFPDMAGLLSAVELHPEAKSILAVALNGQ